MERMLWCDIEEELIEKGIDIDNLDGEPVDEDEEEIKLAKGNWGHKGRPGAVGGSSKGGGVGSEFTPGAVFEVKNEDLLVTAGKGWVPPTELEDINLPIEYMVEGSAWGVSKAQFDGELKQLNERVDKLTNTRENGIPDQTIALFTQNPVSTHYELINDYVRDPSGFGGKMGEFTQKYAEAANKLDSTFDKARLKENVTAFRGVNDKEISDSIQVGTVLSDKGYSMFSMSPTYSALFASGGSGSVGRPPTRGISTDTSKFVVPNYGLGSKVLIQAKLPKGIKGIVPPLRGTYTNESGKEVNNARFNREGMVVLPRGSSFKVVKIIEPSYKTRGIKLVQVELVEE